MIKVTQMDSDSFVLYEKTEDRKDESVYEYSNGNWYRFYPIGGMSGKMKK